LVPYTAESLVALVNGVEQFREAFGLPAAAGLREFLVSDDVAPEYIGMLSRATGTDPWVFGFAVVDVRLNQVVGTAGFKGPPDAGGRVEIAYGIVPEFRGRGYATTAAGKLVDFARGDLSVKLICAHTLPENNASTRVLAKNGFAYSGQVDDPDDGTVWRWELPVHGE
jgi:RimJ/RimL family protein N-acetyltransferase